MNNKWLIVVPARLGSTRLKDKPLKELMGKPLVVRVYENLKPLLKTGAKIVVATDSNLVVEACQLFGIEAAMTKESHESGTDRVYEVALRYGPQYVLNVQGDEPFVNLEDLSALTTTLEGHSSAQMATLYYKNHDPKDLQNPNIVKVVKSKGDFALYFSRSPLPYGRDQALDHFLQHLGVYAYKTSCLSRFCQMPKSYLEETEKLEQLRALENDIPIALLAAKNRTLGIDTEEDLKHALAFAKANHLWG